MIYPTFELVEPEAHSSFRCVHSRCDTFAAEHPLHFHPAFELTLILRSSGTRFVGDDVARYDPGDLVLSGPNLPHCWRDDPDPGGGNAPEWIIAQFDPACFGADFLRLPEMAAVSRLLKEAGCGLAFDPEASADVTPSLMELPGMKGLPRLIGLIAILERLANHPRARLASVDLAGDTVDRALIERLSRVQTYIVANLDRQITQSEIAAQLGMSSSTFSKFFRAATGRTFTSLVKLLRINEACRLLATTEARITQVALDCGYGHTSHFDRHFQELKGMSPSAYRRRLPALGLAASERRTKVPAENTR